MISSLVKCLAATLTISVVCAQQKGQGKADTGGRKVSIRMVYLTRTDGDPVELYFSSGKDGKMEKGTVSTSVSAEPVNGWVGATGTLSFKQTAEAPDIMATAAVPTDMASAIVFLRKSQKSEGGEPYQALVVGDDFKDFPKGGSFVCNLSTQPVRVSIGGLENELEVGKSSYVTQPKERDGYNMASITVSKKDGQDWKPVKDSMHRFADTERYFIFLLNEDDDRPTVKLYKQPVEDEAPKKAKK